LVEKTIYLRLPIKSIEELKAAAEAFCGVPLKPPLDDEIVAAIKWVDETVIDEVGR
jgi:citrate lyase subunit alpha/citrate CoA-transferase